MGYIGPVLIARLRVNYPTATLIGYDTGYFANCLTNADFLPERMLNQQIYGDVRNFPEALLQGIDMVVNLAAISNDPMGTQYEDITMEVNYTACIRIARMAKANGVKSFVFASSCSIYGANNGKASETSNVNPLTAYARSKVYAERDLRPLADHTFAITCLRFATACGMSPRLRLDLVLNDFVACALSTKNISILSDGTPWRPLIHVKDMALAIEWALSRSTSLGNFMAVNVGSEEWNFQIISLANAVAAILPNVNVSVNKDAPVDKRSYQVNFGLYKVLAPNHQPEQDLTSTILALRDGLLAMHFSDADFRDSNFMRIKALATLKEQIHLNADLKWNFTSQLILA
jgi:nucleoside-diphosphate-sugar epimerase